MQAMKDFAVSVDNLVFSYGEKEALQGVNLQIQQGEYVAIVGRNGSGKSTLARHINALHLPKEGKVYVFSLDTQEEKNVIEIRRRAGMVFQNPDNQIVASIVEEDCAFGPENLGIPPLEIRERVTQALETVGMSGYELRAPHMLSGGQKQRVAIAGVLAMHPDMILFDESTSMLDPQGRQAVIASMQMLHDEGITIVNITHNMDEAALCDRVIVMQEGKVALSGTPQELFLTHADEISALGLELPPLVKIANELKQQGIDAADGMNLEDMVERLCQ